MKRPALTGVVACMAVLCSCAVSSAFTITSTTTLTAYPWDIPDESLPRYNGDAPIGWGNSSWQGPAAGKSNFHVRYNANGSALNLLFPNDAATMTINDLASISYFTKRPDATPSGQDWWVQIYTRWSDDGGNASSWYRRRFISNYNDHTVTDLWTLYSTDSTMTFSRNDDLAGADTGERTLTQLKDAYGNELIEMISIQTDSAWNGFDGYVDGLTIELTNGNVGLVDLAAVPEPTSLVLWSSLGCMGLIAARRRRRKA